MYFNFIVNGNIILDSSYSFKNFGQEYVNIIDFNIMEKRQQKLLNKYTDIINSICYISSITPYGEKDDTAELNNLRNRRNNIKNINNLSISPISFKDKENLSFSLNQSSSASSRNIKNKEHDELGNSTIESSMNTDCFSFSVNEENFKNMTKKMKKTQSILREHKKDTSFNDSSSSRSRVSFGNVQFSYYFEKKKQKLF